MLQKRFHTDSCNTLPLERVRKPFYSGIVQNARESVGNAKHRIVLALTQSALDLYADTSLTRMQSFPRFVPYSTSRLRIA